MQMPDGRNQKVRLMRRKFLLACAVSGAVVGAVGLPAFAAAARADRWLIYQNDRYGTTFDYPDRFRAEPPPGNDDGRKFSSTDVAEYEEDTIKNLDPAEVVTYKARGDDWFVVSGTKGDAIFYERHLLSHGGRMTEGLSMTYPAAAKLS